MTKRARSEDEENKLLFFLGEQLFRYLIMPHLSGVDLARLGRTCKTFYEMTKNVRRVKLHMMNYRHPRDVPYFQGVTDLSCDDFMHNALEQLKEYGFTGEGTRLWWNLSAQRCVIMNDFYGRNFESSHWDQFVQKLGCDKEFGFEWRFLQFPTLPSKERYKIPNSDRTVHRGSCIYVIFDYYYFSSLAARSQNH